jgi:hypothetical protein
VDTLAKAREVTLFDSTDVNRVAELYGVPTTSKEWAADFMSITKTLVLDKVASWNSSLSPWVVLRVSIGPENAVHGLHACNPHSTARCTI